MEACVQQGLAKAGSRNRLTHLGDGRMDKHNAARTAWVRNAIGLIEADFRRSSDTHLLRIKAPAFGGLDIYLKDESTHPTGSLKHRLARSLFLYFLCNGQLGPGTPVIEASSGSTAVSEAYFANLVGLPFHAVVPATTSEQKIREIVKHGGAIHAVSDSSKIYDEAEELAQQIGGVYFDQFSNADRVTDWRGNNNIAEAIFSQMECERFFQPAWIVCGAGTGGTSATIGRYIRYRRHETRLCLVDPKGSAFYAHWAGEAPTPPACSSLIEGIGRPRVEPSFIPTVIDRMEVVEDTQSIAAARALSQWLGRPCGASTGANMIGVLRLAKAMRREGRQGSIVSLICDDGHRYSDSYACDDWLRSKGLRIGDAQKAIARDFGWHDVAR